MSRLPLISHASLDAVLAYRNAAPVTARQFLRDARRIGAALRPGAHVVNFCNDRYRFAVGLAGALLANAVSVLPSSRAPAVIRRLHDFAADVVCLTDDAHCEVDLPLLHYSEPTNGAAATPVLDSSLDVIPTVDSQQRVAYVFTSGSTGSPVPHKKTWGHLVECVRASVQRLGWTDGRSRAIVSTVPAQHMYGFESSVLLALQGSGALCAERPFYPADVASVLGSIPSPRILVTTPIHLRTLLSADIDLPPLECIVSATAPLSVSLARDAESRFNTPLLEIYGSTETGQIATRHTARDEPWELWPGVQLSVQNDQVWAEGGHVEERTLLHDIVEVQGAAHFVLQGRTEDMVNIAGKRTSIAYLNHQLQALPQVIDGAFFLQTEELHSTLGVQRLAAVVVAPDSDVQRLTAALRDRIDAAFLPRPLLLVDKLPRSASGKLPREALYALLAQHPLS